MGTDREKVIRGKLLTWEKVGAEKGRYKGGKKEGQVIVKGMVSMKNMIETTIKQPCACSVLLELGNNSDLLLCLCNRSWCASVVSRLGWKQG